MLKVIFSEEALQTFDALKEQIDMRWGEKFADDFENRILKVIATIQLAPLIFQAISQESNVRKAFIHKNCSFLYEVSESQIDILYFWDNRQEPLL